MSKKSVFYTIAMIALALVMFASYSGYTALKLSEKMDSIQTRIETLNFFLKDVENDLSKGAHISGFRALLSFNQFIATNGSYLKNLNSNFKEAFLNGTLEQKPLSLMQDSTFTDWANKISAQASKIGVLLNFTINDVKISQSEPWSVQIELNMTLDVKDEKNTSFWIRDKHLATKISILDFEDPLYLVNSGGRVTSAIRKANNLTFVLNGNATNLLIHANNSYYIVHNDSPSFLMRLEGNTGNSSIGIESLVDLDKFIAQGLPVKDKSIVDSIYFGNKSTINYRINNTPEWFKIDQEHLETYQVEDITI